MFDDFATSHADIYYTPVRGSGLTEYASVEGLLMVDNERNKTGVVYGQEYVFYIFDTNNTNFNELQLSNQSENLVYYIDGVYFHAIGTENWEITSPKYYKIYLVKSE